MDSTILELSRYTTTDKPLNGEWTNRLVKPVTLEQGDYISVKNCFIDTRQIDNNSILIEREINWTFRFIYWIQNTTINQYAMGSGTTLTKTVAPDGLPYMLLDARLSTAENGYLRGKPVVESFVVNIPAGTYERPYFAEYITRQLQGIKTPQNYLFNQNYLARAQTTPVYTSYDGGGTFEGFSEFGAPDASNNPVTSFVKPMYYGKYDGIGAQGPIPQTMFFKTVFNGQPEYPQYSPGVYFRMTNAPNYEDTVTTLATLINNNTVTKGFVYNGTDYDINDGSLIGASQMSFVYNDNGGDNRFSFQYMHTPIMTSAASGTSEVVGTCSISTTGNSIITNKITYLNANSGIMLVDTSTDGDTEIFLNQLGFTYNDLVPKDVAGVFAYNNNCIDNPTTCTLFDYNKTFLPYTTRNKLTVGDLSTMATTDVGSGGSSTYKIISNQSIYSQNTSATSSFFNFSDSQVTDDIVAKNPPISSNTNAGHYLIEITDAYTSTYINQDKLYNIKAIVGNYFLSGDSYAQSLGNDSYIYQHTGVSSTINSIRVRILNPITKEPELNLGPNSTIYLQITKEPPTPQQEQNPHK